LRIEAYFPPPPLFWVTLTTGGTKEGLLNDLLFNALPPENIEGVPLKLKVGSFISCVFDFAMGLLYNILITSFVRPPETSGTVSPR